MLESLILLVFELPLFFSASVLEFDDSKMQKTYETISFKEVHDEIVELKVLALSICFLAFFFVFIFHYNAGVKMHINYHHLWKSNANH